MGFGFYEWSKFDHSHWIVMSPLTLVDDRPPVMWMFQSVSSQWHTVNRCRAPYSLGWRWSHSCENFSPRTPILKFKTSNLYYYSSVIAGQRYDAVQSVGNINRTGKWVNDNNWQWACWEVFGHNPLLPDITPQVTTLSPLEVEFAFCASL